MRIRNPKGLTFDASPVSDVEMSGMAHGEVRVALADRPSEAMTLPLSFVAFVARMGQWNGGLKVQDAFPMLSPDQREFLMTGLTAEAWNELFPDEDA
jgi:hypothetical protein